MNKNVKVLSTIIEKDRPSQDFRINFICCKETFSDPDSSIVSPAETPVSPRDCLSPGSVRRNLAKVLFYKFERLLGCKIPYPVSPVVKGRIKIFYPDTRVLQLFVTLFKPPKVYVVGLAKCRHQDHCEILCFNPELSQHNLPIHYNCG